MNKHYPFHLALQASLPALKLAETEYDRVMRVLGPRYLQQPAAFKGSRDLVRQFVIDTTQQIYPKRSSHWLARIWRRLCSLL